MRKLPDIFAVNENKISFNAKQLRVSAPSKKQLKMVKHQPIVIVLDNVWDTFNIGSFFRLADAVSAEKVYLCGETITPPNLKIHRAAVGTERWVDWEHHSSTVTVVKKLKQAGYFVVAAEQSPASIPYLKLKIKTPIAIIVGHETKGVSKEVLAIADKVVELPLLGVNKSLNVLVAASAILYHWLSKIGKNSS